MAESIFSRVRRLLSGRVEDTVDAMERANSDVTMREAIREVDRAVDEVRANQERAMTRRLHAARQQAMITKKLDELTEKARFALQEGREDLAESAIARQVEFETQARQLDEVQSLAREEEGKLDESVTALRARKRQMEEALAAYAIARVDASMGGDGGFEQARHTERKVERAEAAFDRAMKDSGGVGLSRGDARTINKVAEIDGLQKSAIIAQRIAALKQENAAA